MLMKIGIWVLVVAFGILWLSRRAANRRSRGNR